MKQVEVAGSICKVGKYWTPTEANRCDENNDCKVSKLFGYPVPPNKYCKNASIHSVFLTFSFHFSCLKINCLRIAFYLTPTHSVFEEVTHHFYLATINYNRKIPKISFGEQFYHSTSHYTLLPITLRKIFILFLLSKIIHTAFEQQ